MDLIHAMHLPYDNVFIDIDQAEQNFSQLGK